jgi:light-independent protochlorophyllide reductase subunit B
MNTEGEPTTSPAQTESQQGLSPTPSSQQKVSEMIQHWTREAELELKKIPFFVRGKAKRNTEKFAKEKGVQEITLDTLYDAKAHFKS